MKAIFAVILLAGNYATTVLAQEARYIDFTQALIGLDGNPIMDGMKDHPKPITLDPVAVQALESPLEDDRQGNGDTKFKVDLLAWKIYQNKDVGMSCSPRKISPY